MKFALLVTLTLVVHLVLGWIWGVAGGVAAGWLWPGGGWWKAAAVVGTAWALLVAYSLLVATRPSVELHRILGDIAGGIPPWTVPFLVIGVGMVLGLAGGLVGAGIRRAVPRLANERTI